MLNDAIYTPRRKRISLTALIDVVFILLMFFMLSSSFTTWQAVELASPTTSAQQSNEPSLFLFLDEDDSISLSNGKIDLANHAQLTSEHAVIIGDSAVVMIPQASVNVQTIINAFEQLQSVGVSKVTLGNSRSSLQPTRQPH